jgi:hypothetical protein
MEIWKRYMMRIDSGIDRAWEGYWLTLKGLTSKEVEDINTLVEAYKKIKGIKDGHTTLKNNRDYA